VKFLMVLIVSLMLCLSCDDSERPINISEDITFSYIKRDGMCFAVYAEKRWHQGYMGITVVPCENVPEARVK